MTSSDQSSIVMYAALVKGCDAHSREGFVETDLTKAGTSRLPLTRAPSNTPSRSIVAHESSKDIHEPFQVSGVGGMLLRLLSLGPAALKSVKSKVFTGQLAEACSELDTADASCTTFLDELDENLFAFCTRDLVVECRRGSLVQKYRSIPRPLALAIARNLRRDRGLSNTFLCATRLALHVGGYDGRYQLMPVMASRVLAVRACPTDKPLSTPVDPKIRFTDLGSEVRFMAWVLPNGISAPVGNAAAESLAGNIDVLRTEVWDDDKSFVLLHHSRHTDPLVLRNLFIRRTESRGSSKHPGSVHPILDSNSDMWATHALCHVQSALNYALDAKGIDGSFEAVESHDSGLELQYSGSDVSFLVLFAWSDTVFSGAIGVVDSCFSRVVPTLPSSRSPSPLTSVIIPPLQNSMFVSTPAVLSTFDDVAGAPFYAATAVPSSAIAPTLTPITAPAPAPTPALALAPAPTPAPTPASLGTTARHLLDKALEAGEDGKASLLEVLSTFRREYEAEFALLLS